LLANPSNQGKKVSDSKLYAKLIDEIRNMPKKLDALVLDLNDEQLDTPYGAGKWTVRQVVHHLADSHSNAFARMKWILTEKHTNIKPYDQDLWAKLPDSKLPIDYSMIILHGLHFKICYLLQSLPEESWQKMGEHPDMGKFSLCDLVKIYGDHGNKHLQQIMTLRKSRGW
jgi:hypothetical protein